MLSTGSEQQGQNIRVRTVFLTLTKILDLLVFFHRVCKNSISGYGEYSFFKIGHKNLSTAILPYTLLAHRSRRLTGELIGYPWIRRPSVVVRPFTFSNIFSSETAWPIKAKFYVEPPWEGGTKVCINGQGHMTKMAAMPIYGKNLKKSSSPEPEVL